MQKLKVDLENRTAFRNVLVLALAQAFVGSQLPMHFILGGLAGAYLTQNLCFATLPISMIIIGSTITAPFLSNFMQKFGRRNGFILGTFGGAVGASTSSFALFSDSFYLLLLGSLITGTYMSSYGLYRFAATDLAKPNFKPKAISYVMAAGLISAILGPQLVKITWNLTIIPFLGSYLTIIFLNLIGPFIFNFLISPSSNTEIQNFPIGRNRLQLLQSKPIRVAIVCGMIAYALMNLMMTAAPLAIVGCGFNENNAADVVMAHVLAMTTPSFFTGHLIVKFGVKPVIFVGLAFLLASAFVGLGKPELINFYSALILLGIGWNFSFIGSTSLLANNHTPNERGKAQGMNDMFIFGFVAIASLASGGMINCSGGTIQEGWQFVSISMFPLLAIAVGVTLLLKWQQAKID
ncbi:MAG: MFS transporter [Paracoccaceae bacterium]|nr:MFS transporter [Paracoccaceae bacterium]